MAKCTAEWHLKLWVIISQTHFINLYSSRSSRRLTNPPLSFLKISFIVAALGLGCCTQTFSRWGEQGRMGFSLWWLLLLWSTGSRVRGLQWLWSRGYFLCGLWDLPRPGIESRVPRTGRWILIPWATREGPRLFLKFQLIMAVLRLPCCMLAFSGCNTPSILVLNGEMFAK